MDAINYMIRFGRFIERRDAYFILLLDEVIENAREKNTSSGIKGDK